MEPTHDLGTTALMRAVAKNDLDAMTVILGNISHEDLFAVDAKGRTALDWARLSRSHDAIAVLTAAMEAAMRALRGREFLIEDLETRTRDTNSKYFTSMMEAIKHNQRIELVTLLADSSQHVTREVVSAIPGEEYFVDQEINIERDTAIIFAAGRNYCDVIQELLKLGVDINHANRHGHTAFTWACVCGHADAARLLLQKSANESQLTSEMRSGLHYACLYGKAQVVGIIFDVLLLRFSSFRNTAKFDVSRWQKYASTLEAFIQIKDKYGCTAADLAKHQLTRERTESVDASVDDHKSHLSGDTSQPDSQLYATLNDSVTADVSDDREVIVRLLDIADEKIAQWRNNAALELNLMAPVTCWQNCGFVAKFEEMSEHVRCGCPLKPTVCPECRDAFPAHQIPHHRASVCPKRLIACPNVVTGCKEFITADYLHTHVTLRCEYRLVHCRLHCGGEIALCKRQDHEENHCKRRLLLCTLCNDKFPSMELGQHMKQECPMRQVKCAVGCLGFFNAKDIEYHEKHECVSECRWKCGEILGPANIRLWHELSACPLRPATCANGCNVIGLTAQNKCIHEMNYCRLARVPCPNNCGDRLPPQMLPAHMDPYTGTCPERSVRCPSNFVGWRVRVGESEGVVMRYVRQSQIFEENNSDTWKPDGVDRYYIRFPDGHRWVDYWTSDIIPLKKQMNVNKSSELYPCGWIPYSTLNDHLHQRCCNREVLIGGDSAVVRAVTANTSRLSDSQSLFLGQKTTIADSVAMAHKRVEINEFLSTDAPRTCCDYCSNEIEVTLMEQHLAKECQHVFVRCKLGCGAKVIKKILATHMENECPKRNVNCSACGEELWAEEMDAHLRDTCRCRIVPCTYACGIEQLQAGDLARHCEFDCEWRPYTCSCGDVYPLKDRQDHLITTCPKKLGLCPQGCGVEIPRDELQEHMADHCQNKHVYMNNLINCPIRCGARLRRLDILEHVSYHCIMRVTECPFQCGGTFKYNRLQEHIKICPNRPLCCEKGMKSCRFLMHHWFYKDNSAGSARVSRAPSRARSRNQLGGMLEDDEDTLDDVSETSSVLQESRIMQKSAKLGQESALSLLTDSYYEGSGPLITTYPIQAGDDNSAFTANKSRQRIEFAENESMADSISNETGRKEWVDDLRLLSCPRHGRSLLMYAVKYDEFAMAEFVIRKTGGEDLDIQNRYGDTALTLACRMARLNFVELLVNNGADVNMETISGKTALIEAVKANAMDIVNLLISVGAIVKFKTYKHSKCAMDWAKILKLPDIQRCLEIGELVQAQIEEIFHAISAGDMTRVKEIVGMGDVFYPLNTVRFRVAMEDNAQKLEMSKATLVRLDRDLDVARKSCNEAVAAYEQAHQKEVDAKALSDAQRELCSKMRAEVGFRFTNYETEVYRLSTSDIAEVTSLRTPDRSVLLSVLAYGLLFGILDSRKEYSLEIVEAATWWSLTVTQLARTEEALTTMKNFSWAKLQSDFAVPMADKIIAINAELQGLLKGRKDEREAQVEHTRMLMRQVSTSKQETIQAETDVSQFMLMVQLATNNKDTVLEAHRRMAKRKVALPGEEEESDDDVAVKSEDSLPELKDEEWDSDADDAGDGEWVKGKWVPIVKKSKNWWEKHKQGNREEARAEGTPEQSPRKPFVYIGDNNDPVSNILELQEDEAADELMFVLTMATLTEAVAGMMERMRDIRAEDAKYRTLKATYDDLKKTADMLKITSETEKSRFSIAENENINERKNKLKYERRLHENKERLRVALLLNRVTASGHTAVSWAAAHGFYAAFEMLILHGATVGYNEELIGLSASVIQNTFRLYHYHSGKKRPGDVSPRTKAKTMMLDDGDPTAAAHSVEEMFRLHDHREKTIVKIKRMRRRFRFPVPEAAYGGHWDIVMRVIERKLLHVNFMGSWVFPSPPTPRPRIHRRLNYAEKKHNFMSLVEAGKETLAGGSIVEGVGWVFPGDESEIFSESVRELTSVWKQVCSKIEAFQNTRQKIRLLVTEKRRQQRISELMTFAIKTCNFRECLRLTKEENCTMDFETSEGLTPLIVAAEENVGGLHHEYMVNDDGDPVLAVCFLLDRSYYRPAVNLENAYGVTALIHACSLGREHCVEALIARNANVNRRNRYGETALHAAAKSGSRRCVRMLLESGADADIEDNEGRKAYDVAHGFSFTDVMMQISQLNNGFLGPVQVTRGKVMDTVSCVMGCGLALYPHEIEAHSAICDLRDVPCSLGCGVSALLAREHDNHITYECPHREIECPECHAFVRFIDMPKHADYICPKRLVVCDLGCGSSVRIEDMPKHRVLCSHKLIPCPDNCGETYPMVKRLEHARNHCINRRVPCPLKCTALVVLRVMNNHVKDICPLRKVTCKWCEFSMHHRDLKNHMKQCEYQPAPCKAKCGEYVQVRMMDMHLKTECKHRFIPCTLGCRLKIREVDMERHVTEDCGNRLVPCPLKCRDALTEDIICLPIKQIDVHVNYDCKARTVKCGQCTLEILVKDIELHAAVECLKREVSCRLPGCMKKLPFDQREKHETHSCRHRMMLCPSGCGELVLANRINYHLNQTCGMRYVNCVLGCGALLRHCVMQEHMDVDCARRPGRSRRSSRRDSNKSPLATDIGCKSPLASDISCRSPIGSDFGTKSPVASEYGDAGQRTPFDYDRSEVASVSSNRAYSDRGGVKFPPVVS